MIWFTGTNGNLFLDRNGFRYCIYPTRSGYMVARNGEDIGEAANQSGAKAIAETDNGIPAFGGTESDEPDSFSRAMARVEELREAKRADLARRDRAEWDCFFHFACQNSLLKRQAE
jgi:hypothetical protein